MAMIFTVEFSVNSIREDTDDALASILLHLIGFYREFIAFDFQIIWIMNRYLVGRVHNELHTSITTNWQLTLVKNRAIHSRFTSRVIFAERDQIWIDFFQQIAPETQQTRPAICHVLTKQFNSCRFVECLNMRTLNLTTSIYLNCYQFHIVYVLSIYFIKCLEQGQAKKKTGFENIFGSFISWGCFTNRFRHSINFWLFYFILSSSLLFTIFMWNIMWKSVYYSHIYVYYIHCINHSDQPKLLNG